MYETPEVGLNPKDPYNTGPASSQNRVDELCFPTQTENIVPMAYTSVNFDIQNQTIILYRPTTCSLSPISGWPGTGVDTGLKS